VAGGSPSPSKDSIPQSPAVQSPRPSASGTPRRTMDDSVSVIGQSRVSGNNQELRLGPATIVVNSSENGRRIHSRELCHASEKVSPSPVEGPNSESHSSDTQIPASHDQVQQTTPLCSYIRCCACCPETVVKMAWKCARTSRSAITKRHERRYYEVQWAYLPSLWASARIKRSERESNSLSRSCPLL